MSMNAAVRVISRLAADAARGVTRLCPVGVTIAIPNWNHESVLPRSIRSGLQAVQYLRGEGVAAEVVVLDDQSRDGSLTLLRQLEALYYPRGLRVFARVHNGGLPAARNQLLAHATYRYVAFMDADNELVPQNLFQFYRAIVDTRAGG